MYPWVLKNNTLTSQVFSYILLKNVEIDARHLKESLFSPRKNLRYISCGFDC